MRNSYMNIKFDNIKDIDQVFDTVGSSIHSCLAEANGDKYDYNEYITRCYQMLDYLVNRVEKESELQD